jgi:hypothetical protein
MNEFIADYLMTGSKESLQRAIVILEQEEQQPSLLRGVLASIPMSLEEITDSVSRNDFLRVDELEMLEGGFDDITEDKILRLRATDQDEGSVILMRVVSIDRVEQELCLVPVAG